MHQGPNVPLHTSIQTPPAVYLLKAAFITPIAETCKEKKNVCHSPNVRTVLIHKQLQKELRNDNHRLHEKTKKHRNIPRLSIFTITICIRTFDLCIIFLTSRTKNAIVKLGNISTHLPQRPTISEHLSIYPQSNICWSTDVPASTATAQHNHRMQSSFYLSIVWFSDINSRHADNKQIAAACNISDRMYQLHTPKSSTFASLHFSAR